MVRCQLLVATLHQSKISCHRLQVSKEIPLLSLLYWKTLKTSRYIDENKNAYFPQFFRGARKHKNAS